MNKKIMSAAIILFLGVVQSSECVRISVLSDALHQSYKRQREGREHPSTRHIPESVVLEYMKILQKYGWISDSNMGVENKERAMIRWNPKNWFGSPMQGK